MVANLSFLRLLAMRRDHLTDEQLDRVQALHHVLADVCDTPLMAMVESFRRGSDPEAEITAWEGIAEAYVAYCLDRELTPEKRRAAYQVLLLRSMTPEGYVLQHPQVSALGREEIHEVLRCYRGPTEPPEVIGANRRR